MHEDGDNVVDLASIRAQQSGDDPFDRIMESIKNIRQTSLRIEQALSSYANLEARLSVVEEALLCRGIIEEVKSDGDQR
jgi:hypothetical protein